MINKMYIGPTIRGIVKHGSVFSGGVPPKLELLSKEKPIMKNMLIPISEVANAFKLLREEGTALSISYERIASLSEIEIKEILEGAKK